MIGDALKMLRNIHGYKAKELSDLLDISPSYLSEIENNRKKPNYDLLENYSYTFDIKLSTIVLFSEEFEKNSLTGKAKSGIKNLLIKYIGHLEKESLEHE